MFGTVLYEARQKYNLVPAPIEEAVIYELLEYVSKASNGLLQL